MRFSNKFIKATDNLCDFDNPISAPYFRKKFHLDFCPKKAEITICGLGFYELYINGVNITKGPLAPYINNVNHICYYDNYDLTDLLKEGDNTVGILLGNGMRNSFGGIVWDFDKADFRGPLCTAICLEASKCGNETNYILEADETFKTHTSPILSDDIRMGCCYDARLEIPDWTDAAFDDSDWSNAKFCIPPSGKATLCNAEPIKVYKELPPVKITKFDEAAFAQEYPYGDLLPKEYKPDQRAISHNVYVYDFGENNAGVTRLKINGKPGQIITIRHMEYLINDVPTINNISFPMYTDSFGKYIECFQKDVYICKGGEETFIPKFKYDGFRYALVEGLDPEQATKDCLTYLVMSSDVKRVGSFDCSDDTLNRLQQMVQRSDLSNFYYFPTDCPQREKNGWTGDAAASAEQMLLNFDVSQSLEVWLDNIRYAQAPDGALPGIIPTGNWGYSEYGPAWDNVCVMLPYYIYRFNGNDKVIKNNAAMILRYLFFYKQKVNKDGLIDFGLGDWCSPLAGQFGDNSHLSPVRVNSGIVAYLSAKKAALLFRKADMVEEAEYAEKFAEDLKNGIRTHLINFDTMTVDGNCQTSQSLAIYAGIFTDDEYEKAVQTLLNIIDKDIKNENYFNTCGFIGLRVIYHVLTEIGECNLAYKLVTSADRSCYGSWVKRGETTMLENFPGNDGRDTASLNHHFFGDISSWMIQDIAGLRPNPNLTDIAYFEIAPHFVSSLEYATASYQSKFGVITSNWTRNNTGIRLEISVPKNMYGTLRIPCGYVSDFGDDKLTCGNHVIHITKI